MFFFLSKILLFLIQPLNWIIALLLVGWLRRKTRLGGRLLASGVILCVIFTNPLLLNLVTRAWELEPVPIDSIEAPYDVGIVLGGFSRINENFPDRIHLNDHPNRFVHAIQLYQAGKIKKILVAGGSPALVGKKLTDDVIIREFLVKIGIPEEDILIENRSRNTHENAVNSAKVLTGADLGTGRFLLITSASHMRRAAACFRAEGVTVSVFVTDQTEDEIGSFTPSALILPKASAFTQWNQLIKEWFGYAAYKIRGYL